MTKNSTRFYAPQMLPCLLLFIILSLLPQELSIAFGSDLPFESLHLGQESNKPPCIAESSTDVRPLDTDTTIERGLARHKSDVYEFTLSSGQYIRIIANQKGIDVVVSVCGPDGNLVANIDRANGTQGPESVSLLAQASGTYHLRVLASQTIGDNGRYDIRIKELRDSLPSDAIRIKAERATSQGNKFFDEGSLQDSIEQYKQAIEWWKLLSDKYELAVAFYGLGWSYSELGSRGMVKFPPLYRIRWSYESRDEHKQAVESFNQALTLMKELGDRAGQAQAEAGIAWPYLYLGDKESALASFSQALELYQSLGNPIGQARALYGVGWVNALAGEDQNALDSFSLSLPLRRGDRLGEAVTLAGMGRSYNRLGKSSEALDCLERALKLYRDLGNRHGQASALSDKGWVYYSISDYAKAIDMFQISLPLRNKAKDSTGEANARYGIARSLTSMGKLLEAFDQMKSVLDLVEPLRIKGSSEELRTYFFTNVQEYYEFYIELAIRLHQLHPTSGFAAAALWGSERARARELLRILGKNLGSIPKEDEQLIPEIQPLTATGIQALLDGNTLLLEYFLGESRSYVWTLGSNEDINYFELPKRADIEAKALKMHQLMIERSQKKKGETPADIQTRESRTDITFQTIGSELSQMLLGQVIKSLGTKRLIIVAPGALHLVPFGALPIPGRSDKISTPLIVEHEIVYLPSASILGMLRYEAQHRRPSPKTLAVLADPVFSKNDPRVRISRFGRETKMFDQVSNSSKDRIARQDNETRREVVTEDPVINPIRLLGTRWEAQQIASLVPEGKRLLALDFAASRTKAMSSELSDYRIVHFATHALINDNNPALSKIVLSLVDEQGNPQNGFLTLRDVYELKLPSELVVTSACETGRGREVKGEGLIGLTRAFMYSGALRVVVSLWPTNDKATAELMVKFYKKMLGPERMSPARALQAAQIETWKDSRWKAAFFWAPFILEGDWTQITN